jgi:myo-inositol-1(or 4)-monophosphatase
VGERVKKELLRASELSVNFKGDVDLVTEIDLWCEQELTRELKLSVTGSQVLGEETAHELIEHSEQPIKERCADGAWWIIDPIDGTTNFVSGIPHVGISVGFYRDGKPQIGIVYDPAKDEMFSAIAGKGAWLNSDEISVSKCARVRDCVIATGFPYDREQRWERYGAMFEIFLKSSRDLRRFGAASLDLCWVACGRFDGFFEYNLKPWDTAAGSLIAKEAGAMLSSVEAPEDDFSIFSEQVICCPAEVFDEFMTLALKADAKGREADAPTFGRGGADPKAA